MSYPRDFPRDGAGDYLTGARILAERFARQQLDDVEPCADCGRDVRWDEAVQDYQHTDPAAPDCFLIRRRES